MQDCQAYEAPFRNFGFLFEFYDKESFEAGLIS